MYSWRPWNWRDSRVCSKQGPGKGSTLDFFTFTYFTPCLLPARSENTQTYTHTQTHTHTEYDYIQYICIKCSIKCRCTKCIQTMTNASTTNASACIQIYPKHLVISSGALHDRPVRFHRIHFLSAPFHCVNNPCLRDCSFACNSCATIAAQDSQDLIVLVWERQELIRKMPDSRNPHLWGSVMGYLHFRHPFLATKWTHHAESALQGSFHAVRLQSFTA